MSSTACVWSRAIDVPQQAIVYPASGWRQPAMYSPSSCAPSRRAADTTDVEDSLRADLRHARSELAMRDDETRRLRAALTHLEESLGRRERDFTEAVHGIYRSSTARRREDWLQGCTRKSTLRLQVHRLQKLVTAKQGYIDHLHRQASLGFLREAREQADEYCMEAKRLARALKAATRKDDDRARPSSAPVHQPRPVPTAPHVSIATARHCRPLVVGSQEKERAAGAKLEGEQGYSSEHRPAKKSGQVRAEQACGRRQVIPRAPAHKWLVSRPRTAPGGSRAGEETVSPGEVRCARRGHPRRQMLVFPLAGARSRKSWRKGNHVHRSPGHFAEVRAATMAASARLRASIRKGVAERSATVALQEESRRLRVVRSKRMRRARLAQERIDRYRAERLSELDDRLARRCGEEGDRCARLAGNEQARRGFDETSGVESTSICCGPRFQQTEVANNMTASVSKRPSDELTFSWRHAPDLRSAAVDQTQSADGECAYGHGSGGKWAVTDCTEDKGADRRERDRQSRQDAPVRASGRPPLAPASSRRRRVSRCWTDKYAREDEASGDSGQQMGAGSLSFVNDADEVRTEARCEDNGHEEVMWASQEDEAFGVRSTNAPCVTSSDERYLEHGIASLRAEGNISTHTRQRALVGVSRRERHVFRAARTRGEGQAVPGGTSESVGMTEQDMHDLTATKTPRVEVVHRARKRGARRVDAEPNLDAQSMWAAPEWRFGSGQLREESSVCPTELPRFGSAETDLEGDGSGAKEQLFAGGGDSLLGGQGTAEAVTSTPALVPEYEEDFFDGFEEDVPPSNDHLAVSSQSGEYEWDRQSAPGGGAVSGADIQESAPCHESDVIDPMEDDILINEPPSMTMASDREPQRKPQVMDQPRDRHMTATAQALATQGAGTAAYSHNVKQKLPAEDDARAFTSQERHVNNKFDGLRQAGARGEPEQRIPKIADTVGAKLGPPPGSDTIDNPEQAAPADETVTTATGEDAEARQTNGRGAEHGHDRQEIVTSPAPRHRHTIPEHSSSSEGDSLVIDGGGGSDVHVGADAARGLLAVEAVEAGVDALVASAVSVCTAEQSEDLRDACEEPLAGTLLKEPESFGSGKGEDARDEKVMRATRVNAVSSRDKQHESRESSASTSKTSDEHLMGRHDSDNSSDESSPIGTGVPWSDPSLDRALTGGVYLPTDEDRAARSVAIHQNSVISTGARSGECTSSPSDSGEDISAKDDGDRTGIIVSEARTTCNHAAPPHEVQQSQGASTGAAYHECDRDSRHASAGDKLGDTLHFGRPKNTEDTEKFQRHEDGVKLSGGDSDRSARGSVEDVGPDASAGAEDNMIGEHDLPQEEVSTRVASDSSHIDEDDGGFF